MRWCQNLYLRFHPKGTVVWPNVLPHSVAMRVALQSISIPSSQLHQRSLTPLLINYNLKERFNFKHGKCPLFLMTFELDSVYLAPEQTRKNKVKSLVRRL